MSRSPCGSARQPFQVKNVQREPESGAYVVGTPPRKRQVPADDVHLRNLPEYASGKRSRTSRARDLARAVGSPAATTLRIDHSARMSREERYQREFQKAQSQRQWKEAFIKAFPKLVFYLDHVDSAHKTQFTRQITQLGGHVDAFFSRSVTHVVTTRPIPIPSEKENKELSKRSRREPTEHANSRATSSRITSAAHANMPVYSDRNPLDDTTPSLPATDLLCKAQRFGMKIWRQEKLQTILSLLLAADVNVDEHPQDLSEMLHQEKLLGTSERDPAAQRNDYHYFGKHCYYALVTDATNEHRPILIQEYDRNAHEAQHKPPPWPVLYGDVEGRGLFTYFRSKDRQRLAIQDPAMKPTHCLSLRRVASLNMAGSPMYQVPNSSHTPGTPNLMASDNSIALASTVASTTSTSLHSQGTLSHAAAVPGKRLAELTRRMHAPLDLQKEVSRGAVVRRMLDMQQTEDQQPKLRRAHSMTSARDPFKPREKKPGHCENCRCKFEDFDEHTRSRRHRKFAMDENNFVALDELLQRVQRDPIEHGSWDDYAPMYQQDQNVTSSLLHEDIYAPNDPNQDTGFEHGIEYVAGSDIDGEPLDELQDYKVSALPDLLDSTSTSACNLDGTLSVPTAATKYDNSSSVSNERSSRDQHRSQRDECCDSAPSVSTNYNVPTQCDIKFSSVVGPAIHDPDGVQDFGADVDRVSLIQSTGETIERLNSAVSQTGPTNSFPTSAEIEIAQVTESVTDTSVPTVTETCTTPITAPKIAPVLTTVSASDTANSATDSATSIANSSAPDFGAGTVSNVRTSAAPAITSGSATRSTPVAAARTAQASLMDTEIQGSREIPSVIVSQPFKSNDRDTLQPLGQDVEYCNTEVEQETRREADQSLP